MQNKLMQRSEVSEDLKWNIKGLYESEQDYDNDVKKLQDLSCKFKTDYEGKLNDENTILDALKVYEQIKILIDHTEHYASLDVSVDMNDNFKNLRASKYGMMVSEVFANISFFTSELALLDVTMLEKCKSLDNNYAVFFEDIIVEKPHKLDKNIEHALSMLDVVLESPSDCYENTKQMDIRFDNFEVNGKSYEMSFVKFENEYQYERDTDVRRSAYKHFAEKLDMYKHTIATDYNTQIQKEKIMSKMRGFDSVIDYLLFPQKVTRDMYNRQIDTIMTKLAPVMRKYASLIKKNNNLDRMTFADLKLPLFSDYAPKLNIDDAKDYVYNALKVLGDEYLEIAMNYKKDRWVDFAQNIGKSTGGFCASPYKKQPYILLSWTGLLSEVFTLVHEIGHAVHFSLAQKHNSILTQEPSLYLVEAPSTCNEMLLTNYLISSSKDEKFKKWAMSCMIENTYYHNFVTHLLEADYQRKVYDLVDKGETVNAYILSDLMKETYTNFWGDEIDLSTAEYTWMRQPHYYNGLYSYTYSAGLVVATVVSQNILNNVKDADKNWIKFLKSGGTKSPIELCKVANVDISTDKALNYTIDFIAKTVDEIAK